MIGSGADMHPASAAPNYESAQVKYTSNAGIRPGPSYIHSVQDSHPTPPLSSSENSVRPRTGVGHGPQSLSPPGESYRPFPAHSKSKQQRSREKATEAQRMAPALHHSQSSNNPQPASRVQIAALTMHQQNSRIKLKKLKKSEITRKNNQGPVKGGSQNIAVKSAAAAKGVLNLRDHLHDASSSSLSVSHGASGKASAL